jgi:hypothetical protein
MEDKLMDFKYTFSIETDTLNGKINSTKLSNEIKISNIPNVVSHIDTNGDDLDIWFLSELNSDAQIILSGLVNNHDGVVDITLETQPVNIENVEITGSAEKAIKVADTKLEGSSTMLLSPNFCDKTTWYCGSQRIITEELSSNDYLIYESDHGFWVDISHGKIPYEDRIETVSTPYKPHIFVDNTEVTTGFTIDYVTGVITFNSSQEGKIIKATYSYANQMIWEIKPATGKILKLLGTEIKFSKNCNMGSNTIVFQLCIAGNAFGAATTYKNMEDIVKCAMGVGWVFPAMGTLQNDVVCIPFNYITSKDLRASQASSIKISLSSTTAVVGDFACCIGHCLSLVE